MFAGSQPHNSRSSVRFAEATPSISISKALWVMRDNLCLVRWIGPRAYNMGDGYLNRTRDIIEFKCSMVHQFSHLTVGLDVEQVQNGSFGAREITRCPKCNEKCDKLYLVGLDWRCFSCHKLRYFSQGLTSAERWAEKRALLEHDAHRQRGFGEHKSTFARRRANALRKLAELGPPEDIEVRRRPMPPAVTTRYSASWMGPWETNP